MIPDRARDLIENYEFHVKLIGQYVNDISNEESVLQLPFEANCMNWILGHIIWRRNTVLFTLGLEELWDEATTLKYKIDSKPITKIEQARKFSDLLEDLEKTKALITTALNNISDLQLDMEFENDWGKNTVYTHLRGFHWHEAYHIGQLDILRAFILSSRS